MIVGPKDVGKTTTAKQFAKTVYAFDEKAKIDFYKINLSTTLSGDKPILIDEWQNILEIYDLIRIKVDEDSEFGEFILTGSVIPLEDEEIEGKIFHSGAGRFSFIEMYPMSLYESNESLGNISLNELFINKNFSFSMYESPSSLEDIAYYICRGGWPISLKIKEREDALEVARNYYDAILNTKTNKGKRYFKDTKIAERILIEYARNISSEASLTKMFEKIKNKNPLLSNYMFNEYLEKFMNLYILKDIESWNPNLRSKVISRVSSIHHFVDPSLAVAALDISPSTLLNDLNTFGLFFEDLVIRDLRVYSEYSLNASIKHYRDKSGLEVDAVITRRNGEWGAIEIKLGGEEAINKGLSSLRKLKEKIDYEKEKEPSFLAVITGVSSSYKTKDGIYVFPITNLKD